MSEYDVLCTPFGRDLRFAAAGQHPAIASYLTTERVHQQLSVLRVQAMRFDEVQTLGDIQSSRVASEFTHTIMQDFYNECTMLLTQADDSLPNALKVFTLEDLHRTLICDWIIPDSDIPRGKGSWSPAYLRYAVSSCAGRRFFLTRAGHMGLAPLTTKLGDLVVLVAGCDVPLILRKTDLASSVARNDISRHDRLQHDAARAGHIIMDSHEGHYQIVGNACEYPNYQSD